MKYSKKDFSVFAWSYYQFGSRYVYDEKWSILRIVQKENTGLVGRSENIIEKCSLTVGTADTYYENLQGKCVVSQSFFYLGYFAALWSRLAEIGVRTTFIAFTSISALLCEELEERIGKIAKKASIDQEYIKHKMAVELDELRSHYDLVCQLIEQINRSFGFVLLIISCHDFTIAIMDFNNILDDLEIGQRWLKDVNQNFQGMGHPAQYESTDFFFDPLFEGEYIFLRGNPFKLCKFSHPILRFLLLLVVSHRVGSKVGETGYIGTLFSFKSP